MGFDFQVPSMSLEKLNSMCVCVLYSRCEGPVVFQSNSTLIPSWEFPPSESVFQPPKPAAPWQCEGIRNHNICLEHGINGTELALAFLKALGALCSL